jgi:hypothetical protein
LLFLREKGERLSMNGEDQTRPPVQARGTVAQREWSCTMSAAVTHPHVRRFDASQSLTLLERRLRQCAALEDYFRVSERVMAEFEAQVLADLSVLKNQMARLLGDGNSGRIASIENRVSQHEQSLQRAKGSQSPRERSSL